MALVNLAKASDAELLRMAARDPEAFGVFYDRLEADVLAYFWRRTRRVDLSADLAGEVFATALESAASFDPRLGTARSWLYGIVRHQMADAWEHGRVESRARERLGIEPLVVSDESAERIEQLDAVQSGVLGFLDELPEDQRLAVAGRIVDERDYAELASSLACSQSVLRQRVSRGLRGLRERIQEAS